MFAEKVIKILTGIDNATIVNNELIIDSTNVEIINELAFKFMKSGFICKFQKINDELYIFRLKITEGDE